MPQYLIFLGTGSNPNVSTFQGLWKSDGTASGTSAVTTGAPWPFDLTLGVQYVQPPVLAPAGDGVFLYASAGPGGQGLQNLCVSNGAGGQLLSGVAGANGNLGLFPQGLCAFSGSLYFSGANNTSGPLTRDLWVSAGTVSNTEPVTVSSINPQYLAVAFNQLFFSGVGQDTNQYLFSYGAGASGPGPQLAPAGSANFNPYCLATSYVGVYPLLEPLLGQPPLFMGGTAADGTRGLYQFDGSNFTLLSGAGIDLQPCNLASLQWGTAVEVRTGVRMPFKIGNNPVEFSEIEVLFYMNCALFFSGVDGVDAYGNVFRGLWTSQGAPASTKKVASSSHAGLSLDPYNLTAFDGKLYFTGNDSPSGGNPQGTRARGLFCYDPVAETTTQIFKSSDYNFNSYYAASEAYIYNSSWNGAPPPANQTSFGVQPAGNGAPFTMAAFGGSLYFNCTGADGDAALYSWDGQLNQNGQPINSPFKILPIIANIPQYGLSPYCLTVATLAV
jgi:hypothetical protein